MTSEVKSMKTDPMLMNEAATHATLVLIENYAHALAVIMS
jgi:hypothetical protein